MDAAFDSSGYIYVTPVVVSPIGDPNLIYTATAKIDWLGTGTPPYDIVELFDDPCAYSKRDNRDLTGLKEVAIDSSDNLYVINSNLLNESDVLWVYDTNDGSMDNYKVLTKALCGVDIPAPVALHVSDITNRVYIVSSMEPDDPNYASIYGFSKADLSYELTIKIQDMQYVSGITEDPSNGDLWVAGFSMRDVPDEPLFDEPPFYHPYLAKVTPGSDKVQSEFLTEVNDPNFCDIAIPLSIVWTGEKECSIAEFSGDTTINLEDFGVLAWYWLDTLCNDGNTWCEEADTDKSGWVDTIDLFVLARYWMQTGCF
jgi:hypothetical protein